ncbi:MAG: ATP synthase F1 subunit gamma [Candidatus Magasanikbacteria bacterium CG10_big_fil_rev_8_21_14_0_10_40_10]|uniref:ATP synthase gamma chain n=1 Tax=Candidatus Magasanikbacteria bacterium CG10_big_fil_rev_8_21_14_0_10_40_10 TaxID=1974648 RepID=A0A2M6W4Y5_9BACT|nr:MAG: ATP synthase F1 subunit gamma [Candidatus Magasanikbacteria bacterium CG10_big_fil_rev_8_21_14_0_10_40_10]
MPVNTKAIQSRIKSVKNTRKITKAMEMVASAKMRKAVQAALDTRIYANLAWNLLVNLSKQDIKIPLLEIRPVKRLLMVIITSNRGLCGSFNSNIIKKTAQQMIKKDNLEVDVIGVGKKGAQFAKKMGYNLISSFTDISDTPKLQDALLLSQIVIDQYENKKYDQVIVAYTDFKSSLIQVAKLRQVLPVSIADLEKMASELGGQGADKNEATKPVRVELNDYLFEPNKLEVLKIILPRLVETQIYQTLLESAASEHSARMLAMRSASDAADDMISELNLNYNKARQAAITQEISEIVGGAAALE